MTRTLLVIPAAAVPQHAVPAVFHAPAARHRLAFITLVPYQVITQQEPLVVRLAADKLTPSV